VKQLGIHERRDLRTLTGHFASVERVVERAGIDATACSGATFMRINRRRSMVSSDGRVQPAA
jgi:hypothetical protein